LDFARFLVSTKLFDTIKKVENILIDEKSYNMKIVEEIEYGFARDVCFDEKSTYSASDGILTIWDTAEVDVRITRSMAHVIIIQGNMLKNGGEFVVANVYAPCDPLRRQDVWAQLGMILSNYRDLSWCVCGDFNAIWSQAERRSRVVGTIVEDYSHFNQFIDGNILSDLPLCGRNYTWFRGDGVSMSQLD